MIRRGDIYFVDLDPVKGREQSGRRPVLVLSVDAINNLPLVVTVVVGTKGENVRREFSTNVRVSPAESGLPIETVFLCFQIRSIDSRRFPVGPAGKVTENILEKVEGAVRALSWIVKEKLLDLLACPTCGGDILLANAGKYEDKEIIEGVLTCKKCEREYKILRGVPRFAEMDKIEADKAATAGNFGWQWKNFTQEDARYNEQLLGWLQPVKPEFFDGKIVLEGGCGKGRHTKLAAEWGAKEVVGIDLGEAVESAFDLTRDLPNAHIVQCDIFKLPFKKVFDYAFSVGVLHHTPDPKKAFLSLAGKVKKGGNLSAWIYGAENNEWITKYVNPVREGFTSKISQPVLYQLSKLPTLSLFLTTKLVYRPANIAAKPIASKLFYNDYLNHLGTFGWREHHNIVFDHLVAPTAFYIGKDDFEKWWAEIGAEDVEITWHNRNSWCGFGKM